MILTITRKILIAMVGVLLIATSTQAQTIQFGSGLNQFNMEFVEIGSPGNAADTNSLGNPNHAGAVNYTYNMGKFEVSEDMIDKYNAAFGTPNGLTITKDTRGANKPATGVSWYEAARFVNWLNTSQGFHPAYKFTTNSVNDPIELWAPNDAGYNANNKFRNSLANYVLPSADEWYKAAYYNPNTNTYSVFPNGLNTAPTSVLSGTSGAVYGISFGSGPADVTNAGGLSPFGVMGMGGNAWDWEETTGDLVNSSPTSVRGFRGGNWVNDNNFLRSSHRQVGLPEQGGSTNGFRVASVTPVPEPSTWAFIGTLTMGLFAFAIKAKRKPCGVVTPSLG